MDLFKTSQFESQLDDDLMKVPKNHYSKLFIKIKELDQDDELNESDELVNDLVRSIVDEDFRKVEIEKEPNRNTNKSGVLDKVIPSKSPIEIHQKDVEDLLKRTDLSIDDAVLLLYKNYGKLEWAFSEWKMMWNVD